MSQGRLFSAFLILMSFAAFAAASDAIDAKYKTIGAATLGTPAGPETRAAGGGRVRLYANGGIWSSKTTGTHALYGPVYDKYRSLDAEKGELGYPVTDVQRRPDGATQAIFRHGTILAPADGAVEANAMKQATFTADSITVRGMNVKRTARNQASVLPEPMTGPGSSYTCGCETRKEEPGTGSCDFKIMGSLVQCVSTGCRNKCTLRPVQGGGGRVQ
jgi:hypothetical protein